MTRVAYRTTDEDLNEEERKVFDEIKESRGHVVGVFSVILNSPRVAQLTGQLGAYMRFNTILSPLVKELVTTTTLSENSCQFEWGFHEGFSAKAGVDAATLEAIKFKKPLDGLPEVNAELIRYGRELIRKKRVSAPTFAALKDRYNPQELTEITALFGYYCMVACSLNAFEVDPPQGQPVLPEPEKG